MSDSSNNWTPINIVSNIKHASVINTVQAMKYQPMNIPAPPAKQHLFNDFIKPPPEPEIIIQGHTDEQLATAKQQALESGKQQAGQQFSAQLEESKQALQTGLTKAFNQLQTEIPPLVKEWQNYNQEISQKTNELALAIARKVATNALDDHAINNIKQLVEQCLGHIIREPKVTITLHPKHLDDFNQHLTEHPALANVKNNLNVVGDESIEPTDCDIKWHQGGAQLSIEQRWQKIETLLGVEPSPASTATADKKPENNDVAVAQDSDIQAENETV